MVIRRRPPGIVNDMTAAIDAFRSLASRSLCSHWHNIVGKFFYSYVFIHVTF